MCKGLHVKKCLKIICWFENWFDEANTADPDEISSGSTVCVPIHSKKMLRTSGLTLSLLSCSAYVSKFIDIVSNLFQKVGLRKCSNKSIVPNGRHFWGSINKLKIDWIIWFSARRYIFIIVLSHFTDSMTSENWARFIWFSVLLRFIFITVLTHDFLKVLFYHI